MTNYINTFKRTDTVGEIVARRPALSRVFEEAGIDYCCGGKKSVEDACGKKGIDTAALLAELETAATKSEDRGTVDVLSMSLTQLADHIEQTHHVYLKSELPRVGMLAEKVARVHGGEDPRLLRVNETFLSLVRDLIPHLATEEEKIFPLIRGGKTDTTLSDEIRKLESQHDDAGAALQQLRELTDGYAPPEWACNSYRALLDGLARLELDMHQHVHKENNVLFPRAMNGNIGVSA